MKKTYTTAIALVLLTACDTAPADNEETQIADLDALGDIDALDALDALDELGAKDHDFSLEEAQSDEAQSDEAQSDEAQSDDVIDDNLAASPSVQAVCSGTITYYNGVCTMQPILTYIANLKCRSWGWNHSSYRAFKSHCGPGRFREVSFRCCT